MTANIGEELADGSIVTHMWYAFDTTPSQALSNWEGAQLESKVPYTDSNGKDEAPKDPLHDDWKLSEDTRFDSAVHMTGYVVLPSPMFQDASNQWQYDEDAVSIIKDKIKNAGAVSVGYYADLSMPNQDSGDSTYFNYKNWSSCVTKVKEGEEVIANHFVTIVGWDDSYAKENFASEHRPNQDGAWIDASNLPSDSVEGISVKVGNAMIKAFTNDRVAKVPSKVTSLKVKTNKKGKPTLQWKKSEDATGYEVYRGNKKIKITAMTKWTDTKAKTGKTYSYKVRAYQTVNDKTCKIAFTSKKKVKVIPATPTFKFQRKSGKIRILLTSKDKRSGWQVAKKYQTGKFHILKKSIKNKFFKSLKVKKGKRYYYKVRIYQKVKGKKVYSKWTKVKSIRR